MGAAAGIAAGGQVASAAVGGKGAKKVADAQLQANREALAYQRERAEVEDARYRKNYAIWTAGRRQLMERYGIDVGPFDAANAEPPGPSSPEEKYAKYMTDWERWNPNASDNDRKKEAYFAWLRTPQGQEQARIPPAGSSNLGNVIQNPEAPVELGSWNDWAKYGLGQG